MKLTFIANACCIYESEGYRIVSDPWLTEGAFYGSWFHPTPLKTKPQDLATCDAIYLSHLHPDHFDPETLTHFPKDTPIILLESATNYLERMVLRLGFTKLIKIRDGENAALGPFCLTMFKPFTPHPFHECDLGNILDSALVFEDRHYCVLNTNDNTPDLKAAKMLAGRFDIDVAQLNYNAAGPYPACFSGVKQAEESESLLTRNMAHLLKVAEILDPTFVMPFAGAYVIGGKHWRKNPTLGTCSQSLAARYIYDHSKCDVLDLAEGESFTINGELCSPFRNIDLIEQDRYIREELSTKRYDYEDDVDCRNLDLDSRMSLAIENVKRAQQKFYAYPACTVVINGRWVLAMGAPGVILRASLDPRLLKRILDGKAHWNNAEIGCHIEFEREPNTYQPDVHTLLSFLHCPREMN